MNKKRIFTGLLLVSLLIITYNLGTVVANESISIKDDDEDGIDDNFEDYNKRDIQVDIEANHITVESSFRRNEVKDQIRTEIVYDSDGIHFQINYNSKPEAESNLTYDIIYRELIEFVDVNFNGIYDPEIDQNIQNFSLKEFSTAFYEKAPISSDTDLHYIRIQTENETFALNIYIAEEFTIIENSLVTPTQAKIDTVISDFDFLNGSSQLALNIRFNSEGTFIKTNETEDEKKGYATDEHGIITTANDINGFLTWDDNAFIDTNSTPILVSDVLGDDLVENFQKIYFNYQRGNSIYHTSKFGIEGLLLNVPFSPTNIVTIAIVIGAVSAVAVYSVYLYKKDRSEKKEHRPISKTKKREAEQLFDSKIALKVLEEGTDLETLYAKGDINITAISEDFYETIDKLNLKGQERKEFIKEMLSLSPYEREQFLRDMMIQSE